MTLIINLLGLGAIGLVYWFFFMKKESEKVATGKTIMIKVAGGYQPNRIIAIANHPLTLIFHRTDPSDCLAEVTIPTFGIKEFLPLNKSVKVQIPASKAGEYDVVCGMNMQHAKLILEDK